MYHYYVDGYNLLFHPSWETFSSTLEEARKALIQEINTYAEILNWQITLVFDAPLQSEELSRGHYHNIEIIFTAYGMTADEYLTEYFSNIKSPQLFTLVTSDKALAAKVRKEGVNIVPAKEFIHLLRKRASKKRDTRKKDPLFQKKDVVKERKISFASEKKSLPIDQKKLPPLGDLTAWQELFERVLTERQDL